MRIVNIPAAFVVFVAALMVAVVLSCAPPGGPTTLPVSTPTVTTSLPVVTVEEPSENRLRVDGLVEKPLNLSYEAVLAYPSVREVAVLYCPGVYENQPVREWYGVPVSLLLADAGLQNVASRLIFYATDGYKAILSIERISASGAILAYAVDGAPLSEADGYPFRLVSAEMEGDVWIGWVYRIEVS